MRNIAIITTIMLFIIPWHEKITYQTPGFQQFKKTGKNLYFVYSLLAKKYGINFKYAFPKSAAIIALHERVKALLAPFRKLVTKHSVRLS